MCSEPLSFVEAISPLFFIPSSFLFIHCLSSPSHLFCISSLLSCVFLFIPLPSHGLNTLNELPGGSELKTNFSVVSVSRLYQHISAQSCSMWPDICGTLDVLQIVAIVFLFLLGRKSCKDINKIFYIIELLCQDVSKHLYDTRSLQHSLEAALPLSKSIFTLC